MPFKSLAKEQIENIQTHRKDGLSIEEIARQLKISTGVASKYARGIRPVASRTQNKAAEPVAETSGKAGHEREGPLAIVGDDIPDGAKVAAGRVLESRMDNSELKTRVDRLRLQHELEEEEAKGGRDNKRYSVIGDRIIQDPDGVTHAAALAELELHLKAGQPAATPDPQVESLKAEISRLREAESNKHHDEKYSVDPENGIIKVASSTDKTALTWEEAEKLSQKVKKSDSKDAGKDERQTPFTFDKEGNVTIVEGARLSREDLIVLDAMNKSQQRGEKRTAREILEEEIKRQDFLDDIRGKNKSGGDTLDDVERLARLKTLLGTDPEVKELLSKIGQGTGSSSEIQIIRDQMAARDKQYEELRQKLDDQEKQALKDRIIAQDARLAAQDAKITALQAGTTVKNEYDIINNVATEGFKVLKEAGSDLKEIGLQIIAAGKPLPPPMTPEERKMVTNAIGEETARITAKQELGNKIFRPPGKGV